MPTVGTLFRLRGGVVNEPRSMPLGITASGVVWIESMLPRPDLVQILSHARAFACPSVYEPFGIVNLEAMACGAPVVASSVGGIPEIVVPERTGLLVSFEPDGTPRAEPRDPARFSSDLAVALNRLVKDPSLAARFGREGRERVRAQFSWSSIADQTTALYRRLVQASSTRTPHSSG